MMGMGLNSSPKPSRTAQVGSVTSVSAAATCDQKQRRHLTRGTAPTQKQLLHLTQEDTDLQKLKTPGQGPQLVNVRSY